MTLSHSTIATFITRVSTKPMWLFSPHHLVDHTWLRRTLIDLSLSSSLFKHTYTYIHQKKLIYRHSNHDKQDEQKKYLLRVYHVQQFAENLVYYHVCGKNVYNPSLLFLSSSSFFFFLLLSSSSSSSASSSASSSSSSSASGSASKMLFWNERLQGHSQISDSEVRNDFFETLWVHGCLCFPCPFLLFYSAYHSMNYSEGDRVPWIFWRRDRRQRDFCRGEKLRNRGELSSWSSHRAIAKHTQNRV